VDISSQRKGVLAKLCTSESDARHECSFAQTRHEDPKQLNDTPNHESELEEACVLKRFATVCFESQEEFLSGKSRCRTESNCFEVLSQ
jgi:hypothetical protein